VIPVNSPAGTGEQPPKPAEPGTPPDPAKLAAPPAAPGASVPGRKAPVDEKTYQIGAEDVVGVGVWGDPRLSGQFVVRPDGKISIPLIGDVMASGKTPAQLQETIGTALQEKYIKSPDVNVQILQVHSKKYFIEGEVNKPGPYELIVPTTVLEGLSNAGGFRDFANTKKIRILRGSKVLYFNYKEVTNGKKLDQNIYLEPGDHIIIR
jgi:polysaccharide export outer membrane protein